jgi:hypothetical protein
VAYLENAKQFDPVRPGEQWFFYWKTSAALWESRILQFSKDEVIFIPVNWGLHGDAPGNWDFGSSLPERDLLRLTDLLTQHGRKFCWILPMTAAPHLPNGGVPAYAARTLALARSGVHYAVLDNEFNLNKMYSFFEPKIFQSFTEFLKGFGTFLGVNKIKSPVWGAQFYYYQDGELFSFFEDCSLAFEQGFSRYLKKNQPNGTDLTDPFTEADLKENFTKEVSELFVTTAEAALGPFWMGAKKIVALGSGPQETILRSISSGKSQLEYTRDIFYHFVNSNWISSVLLSSAEKKECLSWILSEHFGPKEIEEKYHYQAYSSILSDEFKPFGVIDIFSNKKQDFFQKNGLISYLDNSFRWLYQVQEKLPFTTEWIDSHQHKVKIFHGSHLDRTTFAQMLKLFLMGQTILLDRTGIGEGLDKKLHIFLIENNLKIQSVNYMTPTQVCELGEGKLIVFEGERLNENPSKEKFWGHVFKFLNLVQPEMKMDGDVFTMWRIRATSAHELSYLDVRRVNIYNPTSYKKIVKINTQKHFAFMKMVDPTRANAKSTSDGVDVELLPHGKIALDFGHYEER